MMETNGKFYLGRIFDPQQTKSIMQEQGNLIDPTQKPIIFLEKRPSTIAESTEEPTTTQAPEG